MIVRVSTGSSCPLHQMSESRGCHVPFNLFFGPTSTHDFRNRPCYLFNILLNLIIHDILILFFFAFVLNLFTRTGISDTK